MPSEPALQPSLRPRSGLERAVVPALVLATLVAYARVVSCGFVYDDIPFLLENPNIRPGLSVERALWAFTYLGQFNWHPLAWISHQLDFTLFGAAPLGHHLTALCLHATTSVALYLVLRRMTGTVWRSASVAALFALHPMHVESVAWVAERKDVLSGLFFVLMLAAYTSFVRRPSAGRYLLTLGLLCLGLLAKTMLVTVPFVLLLLDVWPLRRTPLVRGPEAPVRWGRLLLEKAPLLALAILGSAAAAFAQGRGGALSSLDSIPLAARFENALVSYATYVLKLLWPADLAVFYPHPGEHPLWKVLVAAAVLLALTAAAALAWRRRPYLGIGWLWFVGMLVPVIGIVQVGAFALADRYTYLPSIGFFVALCWLVGALVERRRIPVWVSTAGAAGAVLACGVLTFLQVGVWRDGATLFRHALEVTSDNYVAHANLGEALAGEGRVEEALEHFQAAVAIRPDYAIAHTNLGVAALQLGRFELAVEHQRRAAELQPDHAVGLANLGNALAASGRHQEALEVLARASERRPEDAGLHLSLGLVLERLGQDDRALNEYAAGARLAPGDPRARLLAAGLDWRCGRLVEAAARIEAALSVDQDNVDALAFHGAVLYLQGRLQESADVLVRARDLAPGRPDVWVGLGLVTSAARAPDQALPCFERALELGPVADTEYLGFGSDLGAQAGLGRALALQSLGRTPESVAQLESLLQADPRSVAVLTELAWLLATSEDEATRDGAAALTYAERARAVTETDEVRCLDAHAAALAELGRYDEAIAVLERALSLTRDRGQSGAVAPLQARLAGYRDGRPHRVPGTGAPR